MRKLARFFVLASPCQDKYRRLHDGADSNLYIQKPHTINDISANYGQHNANLPSMNWWASATGEIRYTKPDQPRIKQSMIEPMNLSQNTKKKV